MIQSSQANNRSNNMQDFQVIPFDFCSTEVTIVAASEKGKAEFARRFGPACISINLRKSSAHDWAVGLAKSGFTVA
jgi:hypothetical protein